MGLPFGASGWCFIAMMRVPSTASSFPAEPIKLPAQDDEAWNSWRKAACRGFKILLELDKEGFVQPIIASRRNYEYFSADRGRRTYLSCVRHMTPANGNLPILGHGGGTDMTAQVFAMALDAAVLHAAWSALVKVNADRLVMIAIMMMSQVAVALLVIPFVAFPTPESWPYIWGSTVLNTGYCLFLIKAYRYGDLSHVYPISRGCSPPIVAFISIAIVGETLTPQAGFSIVVIALDIMSLALTRGTEGFREPKVVLYAVGTGIFIAGYTVVDGLGARLAESAESYTFWSHLLNGIPITLVALYLRRGRVAGAARKCWKVGVLGGLISLLAYWIVTWAMTQAPLALVSAVRESSMVFAVLFGVFFLKERLDLAKFASIGVTLIGTAMLKISK